MAQSSGTPSSGSSGGAAKVSYGVYDQAGAHFVGKTVGEIRQQQGRLWSTPKDAVAKIGNQVVDDSYQLKSDDHLVFHRKSGEKGLV